jgi:hypothetical protein
VEQLLTLGRTGQLVVHDDGLTLAPRPEAARAAAGATSALRCRALRSSSSRRALPNRARAIQVSPIARLGHEQVDRLGVDVGEGVV